MERPPYEYLRRQANWRPEETAVVDAARDERLSFAELDRRATAFAGALDARDVRPGDRVGVALFNTVEFPVAVYGCHRAGVVPVALNYRFSAGEYAHIFEDTQPELVVCDAEITEAVGQAISDVVPEAGLISVGPRDDDPRIGTAFGTFVEVGSDDPPTPAWESGDLAYMITTSGTTGDPDVVGYSVKNGWARNETSIASSETTPDSVWLSLLPWFHGAGIDTTLRAAVTAGASVVALREYSDPRRVLEAIEAYDVTHVMSSPTLTERIANHDAVDEYDLTGIRCWRQTGEVLTERQVELFRENLTTEIYNSYGSSEAGLNTMLRPEDLPEAAGTVGRPTVRTDVRVIAHEEGREVPPDETVPRGEPGEVIVKTDQLFRGYYPTDERRRERVRDGWFYTHDVGHVDQDGYLTISGRTDDMILSGGELVSAVEVEDALESHDGVSDAVVVGRPDDEWGQRVTAYVVVKEGVTESDLDEYLVASDDLANYKRPREYEFVNSIERTEAGKKRRAAYRDE